jgi:hypothetical protein
MFKRVIDFIIMIIVHKLKDISKLIKFPQLRKVISLLITIVKLILVSYLIDFV